MIIFLIGNCTSLRLIDIQNVLTKERRVNVPFPSPFQGQLVRVHGTAVRAGRRDVHPSQAYGEVQRVAGEVLRRSSGLSLGVSASLQPDLPGSEAGEYPDTELRLHQDDRLRFLQDGGQSHVDVVRHPGIFSTGSDLIEGLWQGRRLVELRRTDLRDERGIPAFLRARSDEDLREDHRGQV